MDPEAEQTPSMTVYLSNDISFECAGFRALEGGVLLFEGAEQHVVNGFIPYDELRFILPDEVAVQYEDALAAERAEDELEDELMRIPGVGTTYASRLRDAGVDSLAAVASAEPPELVEATGARESQVVEWIRQAADLQPAAAGNENETTDDAAASDTA